MVIPQSGSYITMSQPLDHYPSQEQVIGCGVNKFLLPHISCQHYCLGLIHSQCKILYFAEAGWKCKSSIDQSYKQYGAYYDHVTKKLGFHHQPRNKVK